jgi:glycosyltransferase involved in cell wall biosynthesis
MKQQIKTVLVVSHVRHYMYEKKLYAYGPYAREIDIWADIFEDVLIAAPCRADRPDSDAIAFGRSNIKIIPQPETGGLTLLAKLRQMLMVPCMALSLARAMRNADAIHVRCPGNIGLLGVILAPFFSRYLVAKYAGQWNDYPDEPWTVRLQKALLRSRWWRGPVTVYGQWPKQPDHVIPFFTSVLSGEQIARAQTAARQRTFSEPLKIMYAGRLTRGKNVDTLLSAVEELSKDGVDMKCTVVGDGPERHYLEEQYSGPVLRNNVVFTGGMELAGVLEHYEKSDVLVLASESEGWPKAISEGMAFGLICIGSDRGLMPWMLGEGRGITVPPGDVDALKDVLRKISSSHRDYRDMGSRAADWAQRYSLDGLREALCSLLSERWGIHFE